MSTKKAKLNKVSNSVKLSVTSKLDSIRSWSLNALDTCSGSVDANGELVDACKGCYATTGNYRFPNVKAPREHNNTCNGCRACYDKKVKVIAYPAHGVKMHKVIMLKVA